MALNGFSGTPTDAVGAQLIIDKSLVHEFNAYRYSITPSWATGNRPYNPSLLQHFLDHSDLTLIVDRNHHLSSDTVDWDVALQDILSFLGEPGYSFGDNPRVVVELVNEFVWDGQNVWDRCEPMAQEIRSQFSNQLMVNKHTYGDDWRTIGLDYYGKHAYFDNAYDDSTPYQNLPKAIQYMEEAIAVGCLPLVNTEVGVDTRGYYRFTEERVNALNDFTSWCALRGIGTMLWTNYDMGLVEGNRQAYYDKFVELGVNMGWPVRTLSLDTSVPVSFNLRRIG